MRSARGGASEGRNNAGKEGIEDFFWFSPASGEGVLLRIGCVDQHCMAAEGQSIFHCADRGRRSGTEAGRLRRGRRPWGFWKGRGGEEKTHNTSKGKKVQRSKRNKHGRKGGNKEESL